MSQCLSFLYGTLADALNVNKKQPALSANKYSMSSPPASPVCESSQSKDEVAMRRALQMISQKNGATAVLAANFPICYNRPDRVRTECENVLAPGRSGGLPAIMFDTDTATPSQNVCWKGSYAYVAPFLYNNDDVVCKFTFLDQCNSPIFDLALLCNEVLKLQYVNKQIERGLRFTPASALLQSFSVVVPSQYNMAHSIGADSVVMVVQVLSNLGNFDCVDGPLTAREILRMARNQHGQQVLLTWQTALISGTPTLTPEHFAAMLVVEMMTTVASFMQAHQICHGDLNGKNVALSFESKRICVIDFQFARYVSETQVEYRLPYSDVVTSITAAYRLNDLLSAWVDDFYRWSWLVELGRVEIMATQAAALYTHPNLPPIEKTEHIESEAIVYLHCFRRYGLVCLEMDEPYIHYYAHCVFFDQISYAHLQQLLVFVKHHGCAFYSAAMPNTASERVSPAKETFDDLVFAHRRERLASRT